LITQGHGIINAFLRDYRIGIAKNNKYVHLLGNDLTISFKDRLITKTICKLNHP
jgi:threonine synthase